MSISALDSAAGREKQIDARTPPWQALNVRTEADKDELRVIAWNLARTRTNWDDFKVGADLQCDIALLNEGHVPPPELGMKVLRDRSTIGRDDRIYGGTKTRKGWSTAVLSRHELSRPKDVWTLSPENTERRSKLMKSRRGSWTAGVAVVPGLGQVTAIALYGLMDERSDASVHRSLSDLTPLFEDRRYNRLLVLGGDLNTLTWDVQGSTLLARNQGVIDRIVDGFGLFDLLHEGLLKADPPRKGLDGCRCGLGDECRHTWTFRSTGSPLTPFQDDYLFASRELKDRLDTCVALDFRPRSDHKPIEAVFHLGR